MKCGVKMMVEVINIKDLYAKEYEDPRDAIYLNTLKLNKAFDKAFKTACEYRFERMLEIEYTGSHVQVTQKNMPYLYECIKRTCEILNVEEIPKTYVIHNPEMNAFTVGVNHPTLVFHDSLLERLTHDELMFIIGHEIGHIKSEHCQYQMIGSLLDNIGRSLIDSTTIGNLVMSGIEVAFYEWMRCSEFTADHAGLLACQNLQAAISALAKISGFPPIYYDSLDTNEFLEQANDFVDLDENAYNKLLKVFSSIYRTHPWSVLRARELMIWVQNNEYSKIVLRNSTWLENEINRLAKITDKKVEKKNQKKVLANKALQQDIVSKEDAFEIADKLEEYENKDIKQLILKGQKSLKDVKSKLDKNTAKRKIDEFDKAQEKLEDAQRNEKHLRMLFNEISDEILQEYTNNTIGELKRIKIKEE